MLCGRCHKQFPVDRGTRQMFPPESMSFCSEQCLLTHIRALPPLSPDDIMSFGMQSAHCAALPRECYSPLLDASFRSWFECLLAERIVFNWKTRVFYEPHALPVNGGDLYIPDFWLPEYGVWLEPKGEWRIGAKKKFVAAQKILSPERLLLVPPLYRRWFSNRQGR